MNRELWGTGNPDGPFDYIVIGSGMGGLTCAASLAAMGRRVLVLEQHYTPGGCMHSFRRKQWSWDIGVHLCGEVTEKDEFGRLLSFLTGGRLKWASLGGTYDRYYWPDGFFFDYPDDPDAYQRALLDKFPAEERGIRKWFELIHEAYDPLMWFFKARALPKGMDRIAQSLLARRGKKFIQARAKDVLDELTDDPRLKAVLTAQWFYWGTPPSRCSMAVNLLAARMFLWGGYCPVGGSAAIIHELLRTVAGAGGCARVRADVEQIIVHKGRAVGVRVRNSRGGPSEEIRADRVVSAAGIYSTVTRLLPEDYREARWVRSVTRLEPNEAHVCLYLGYRGDVRLAGASPTNLGLYDTWDLEKRWKVDVDTSHSIERAPFLWCGFGSLKDPTRAHPINEIHTGEVMAFLPWEAVTRWLGTRPGHRDSEYVEFKQRLTKTILGQFLERMPGLAPMIEHVELSTPLSTDHYLRPMAGSIYGLHTTIERLTTGELRARSPIKNLFFAGNEVALSGVAGAGFGGVLAAIAAEPLRSRILLRAMRPPKRRQTKALLLSEG